MTGTSSGVYRHKLQVLLFTFLLTMRGTPSLYIKDELGMTNIRFRPDSGVSGISKRKDYWSSSRSGRMVGIRREFLKDQQLAARDNSRTPFQWNGVGYTRGSLWQENRGSAVNENYRVVNAAVQETDPGFGAGVCASAGRTLGRSVASWCMASTGGFMRMNWKYTHISGSVGLEQRMPVLLNFSGERPGYTEAVGRGRDLDQHNLLLWRVRRDAGSVWLRPWQALVLKQTKD